jgi:hypothetical protein
MYRSKPPISLGQGCTQFMVMIRTQMARQTYLLLENVSGMSPKVQPHFSNEDRLWLYFLVL